MKRIHRGERFGLCAAPEDCCVSFDRSSIPLDFARTANMTSRSSVAPGARFLPGLSERNNESEPDGYFKEPSRLSDGNA